TENCDHLGLPNLNKQPVRRSLGRKKLHKPEAQAREAAPPSLALRACVRSAKLAKVSNRVELKETGRLAKINKAYPVVIEGDRAHAARPVRAGAEPARRPGSCFRHVGLAGLQHRQPG